MLLRDDADQAVQSKQITASSLSDGAHELRPQARQGMLAPTATHTNVRHQSFPLGTGKKCWQKCCCRCCCRCSTRAKFRKDNTRGELIPQPELLVGQPPNRAHFQSNRRSVSRRDGSLPWILA